MVLACPFVHRTETSRQCVEEKCALWYDGDCTFVSIARSLLHMNEEIHDTKVKVNSGLNAIDSSIYAVATRMEEIKWEPEA